jgi:V/A-type H+-transporting ATPase subunit K
MDSLVIALGHLGFFAPLALGAIGSAGGCAIAGQAALGSMLDIDSGYGKYMGLVAMPSTHSILGIVVSFQMGHITAHTGPGYFAIGLLTGLALMACGIYQGHCCASAMRVWKSKPQLFGLSIAPAAIVEGFAVFTFVFALLALGNIKG